MKEAFCCNEVYETRLLTFSVTTTEKTRSENSLKILTLSSLLLAFLAAQEGKKKKKNARHVYYQSARLEEQRIKADQ